jgi:hypothetical protein
MGATTDLAMPQIGGKEGVDGRQHQGRRLGLGPGMQAGEVPPDRLWAGIAESWRRSQLYAVDRAGLDPPFIGDLDTDGPLMRAARPVLDRLAETLSEVGVGLFVTDASGRVLHRRVLDRAFMRPTCCAPCR